MPDITVKIADPQLRLYRPQYRPQDCEALGTTNEFSSYSELDTRVKMASTFVYLPSPCETIRRNCPFQHHATHFYRMALIT